MNRAIAKVFSERYATVKSLDGSSSVLVQISNVTGHETLDAVQEYLARLGVVNDIYLAEIIGDTAHLWFF